MIKAEVIADSKNEQGNRITTMVVTFPRFILAELNTHRMMSRNSASSRAIPFKKMLKSVMENPFIPIAFQKDHSGMQGSEYLSSNHRCEIGDFILALNNLFNKEDKEDKELIEYYLQILIRYSANTYTLKEWWLKARDMAVEASVILSLFGVTKQLCNRLLEPFMWHTVIITATEWENFFALRCPRYYVGNPRLNVQRSWKDVLKEVESIGDESSLTSLSALLNNNLGKLYYNTGQAEIHMMALAEAMWDAYNESTPKELRAGEWHIPFVDTSELDSTSNKSPLEELAKKEFNTSMAYSEDMEQLAIKIATARCARVSYTVVGEEGKPANYTNDIKLHDRLAESGHWSPFEHCARAMTQGEFWYNTKQTGKGLSGIDVTNNTHSNEGWSGNFRGFIQYRKMFNQENITK